MPHGEKRRDAGELVTATSTILPRWPAASSNHIRGKGVMGPAGIAVLRAAKRAAAVVTFAACFAPQQLRRKPVLGGAIRCFAP